MSVGFWKLEISALLKGLSSVYALNNIFDVSASYEHSSHSLSISLCL